MHQYAITHSVILYIDKTATLCHNSIAWTWSLEIGGWNERWRADVQQKIAAGVAQAKAGRLLDGDEAFDEVMERIDERRKISP